MIDKLVVYPEAMRANLDRLRGLLFSQKVLLALTQAGMSREDAYRLVQRHAMAVWNGEGGFLELLRGRSEVSRLLDTAGLDALFDLARLHRPRRHDLRPRVRRG